MNQIDEDFVYKKFPKTEHDIKLLETYKKDCLSGSVSCDNNHALSDMLIFFPVYEGTSLTEKDYLIS